MSITPPYDPFRDEDGDEDEEQDEENLDDRLCKKPLNKASLINTT